MSNFKTSVARVTFALVVISITSPSALAQDFAKKAEVLFDQGNYSDAEKIYSDAAAQGAANGHLYYNLGITAYRQAKIGEAMAGFLAARSYLPRDPDVAANLKFMEGRIKDKLDSRVASHEAGPFAFWFRMARSFTAKELAYSTVFCLLLWALLTNLGLLWSKARWLLPTAWYALVVPCFPAALFITNASMGHQWGAVIEKNHSGAKIYSGPSKRESVLFELHEGAPVLVRGPKREGFWPIELSDGKKGWIAAENMRVWI